MNIVLLWLMDLHIPKSQIKYFLGSQYTFSEMSDLFYVLKSNEGSLRFMCNYSLPTEHHFYTMDKNGFIFIFSYSKYP